MSVNLQRVASLTAATITLATACAPTQQQVPTPAQAGPRELPTSRAVTDCRPGLKTVTIDGMRIRTYIPPGATSTELPTVMLLHGADSTGQAIREVTQLDQTAEANGFMAVYPDAPGGSWSLTRAGAARLTTATTKLACTDANRIYLAGFSRGSAMAFNVACSASHEVFAAYGGVSMADFRKRCVDAAPAAIVYLHGTKDQTVGYFTGYRLAGGRQTPSSPQAMRAWARHNRCESPPALTRIGEDVLLKTWRRCTDNSAIEFFTVRGGDHQWPFASRPNAPLLEPGQSWASVGANEVMWDFFGRHSLATR